MSEKKVVRTLALACVILLAGLVGTFVNYRSVINSKDNTITDLQRQKNQLQTLLYGNVTYYELILSLQKLEIIKGPDYTLSQDPNTFSVVIGRQFKYAGYLLISSTSTTDNAYFIVEYWFQGRLFSFRETVGTSGQACFVVLPTNVAIYVGNTNTAWPEPAPGVTHTMTITYYYLPVETSLSQP